MGIERFEEVDAWSWLGASDARAYARIAAEKTGVPLEEIRETMICDLAGLISHDIDKRPYKVLDPWITQHSRELQSYCYAGDFCWQCLLEGAYLRLSWRLSLFVSCPNHHCLLSHLCGHCGRQFWGINHLQNVDISNQPDAILTCFFCQQNLATETPITPASPIVTEMEAINKLLIRNGNCLAYFSVLHSMLGMLGGIGYASKRLRNEIARMPHEWDYQPRRFELCEPIQRQYMLQAIVDLFEDWPSAFVCAVRSSGVPHPFRGSDSPQWYEAAAALAKGNRRYTEQFARETFWLAAEREGWRAAAEFLTRQH
jgi:hypothetical protein